MRSRIAAQIRFRMKLFGVFKAKIGKRVGGALFPALLQQLQVFLTHFCFGRASQRYNIEAIVAAACCRSGRESCVNGLRPA